MDEPVLNSELMPLAIYTRICCSSRFVLLANPVSQYLEVTAVRV